MSRLSKAMIIKMLRDANCIETLILSTYFNSVWVGETLKGKIEIANRKLMEGK